MDLEQRRIKEHVQKQIKKIERGGSEYSLYKKGFYYIENGKFEAALKYFNEIIIKSPKLLIAFFGRSFVYLFLDKIEECLNDINSAIKIKSDKTDIYPALYAFRGFVYFLNKNTEKALEDLDKSLELDSTQQEPYNLRGAIYKLLDKNEDSLNNFSKAIEINSTSFDSYSGRALTYISLKKYEESANDFNKVIELVGSKEEKKFFASLAYSLFLAEQQFDLAKSYIDKIFEESSLITANESLNKRVYLDNIDKAKEIYQKNQQLEEAYLLLQEDYKAEIEEKKRFEEMSIMATGVAHEINQPVGIIRASVSAAQTDLKENLFSVETELNPLLNKIFDQTQRLEHIIDNFRAFSRGDHSNCEIVDLNKLVDQTISVLNSQLKSIQIIIERNLHAKVWANFFALERVLINLLKNAKEALENRENPTIWIKINQQNQDIIIVIEDNGCGVDPSFESQLFTPFISTKSTSKGTGLGLNLSRRLIEEFNGQLTYQPRQPNGASFKISLPLFREENYHG